MDADSEYRPGTRGRSLARAAALCMSVVPRWPIEVRVRASSARKAAAACRIGFESSRLGPVWPYPLHRHSLLIIKLSTRPRRRYSDPGRPATAGRGLEATPSPTADSDLEARARIMIMASLSSSSSSHWHDHDMPGTRPVLGHGDHATVTGGRRPMITGMTRVTVVMIAHRDGDSARRDWPGPGPGRRRAGRGW
jgi:hypothetical protein